MTLLGLHPLKTYGGHVFGFHNKQKIWAEIVPWKLILEKVNAIKCHKNKMEFRAFSVERSATKYNHTEKIRRNLEGKREWIVTYRLVNNGNKGLQDFCNIKLNVSHSAKNKL